MVDQQRSHRAKTGSRLGFTIVELLIVIVVIAILAAISIVAYTGVQNRARASAAQAAARQLAGKVEVYSAENDGRYPETLADISVANSGTTTYNYRVDNSAYPGTWCATVRVSDQRFYVSESQTSPREGSCEAQNLVSTDFSEWESGGYSTNTGNPAENATRVRYPQLVAVEPGASYTFTTGSSGYAMAIRYFTSSQSFASSAGATSSGATRVIPANVHYLSVELYHPSATQTYATLGQAFSDGSLVPNIVRND